MNTRHVVKHIVKGVGYAGAIGVVVIAPNAAVALDRLVKMYCKNSKRGYTDYLKRSGYFYIEQKDDKFVIRLTEKGKNIAEYADFEDYEFDDSIRWDGKWHLLMFDIPETHRKARNVIQLKLKQLGMKQLQNSVYVHFMPTNDLAKIIRQTFPGVSSLVIAASVIHIDGEVQLKKAFRLK